MSEVCLIEPISETRFYHVDAGAWPQHRAIRHGLVASGRLNPTEAIVNRGLGNGLMRFTFKGQVNNTEVSFGVDFTATTDERIKKIPADKLLLQVHLDQDNVGRMRFGRRLDSGGEEWLWQEVIKAKEAHELLSFVSRDVQLSERFTVPYKDFTVLVDRYTTGKSGDKFIAQIQRPEAGMNARPSWCKQLVGVQGVEGADYQGGITTHPTGLYYHPDELQQPAFDGGAEAVSQKVTVSIEQGKNAEWMVPGKDKLNFTRFRKPTCTP